jgi:endo-alpha-1,4-polygalactosaminidase (GH114 family)
MDWGGEWKVKRSEWLKSRVDGWEACMVGGVDFWRGKWILGGIDD